MVVTRPQSTTVGIVANEFLDSKLGRMGGFGWVASHSAECLGQSSSLGFRPVFLSGQHYRTGARRATTSNGVPLIFRDRDLAAYRRALAQRGVSLLLTIDYRASYAPIIASLPRAPLIIWANDPRPRADVEKIATLEIPNDPAPPQGISATGTTSLRVVLDEASEANRSVQLVSPAPVFLEPKAREAYDVATARLEFLPYPLEVTHGRNTRARAPRLVFLGRLDPIKRPWLFVELARRFPKVEFLMLGQAHFRGPGAWEPAQLPENVRLVGHVDGEEKRRLLSSAWALVNTSIHEALPVSFVEALHCGTPVVSCQDPEAVASRFGVYVGRWDGSGLDGLDAFADGLARLLGDRELRRRLGRQGRNWARTSHTRERFLETFLRLSHQLARGRS
jgi:glycosyltransferase involved in cell wall biosynthesis